MFIITEANAKLPTIKRKLLLYQTTHETHHSFTAYLQATVFFIIMVKIQEGLDKGQKHSDFNYLVQVSLVLKGSMTLFLVGCYKSCLLDNPI